MWLLAPVGVSHLPPPTHTIRTRSVKATLTDNTSIADSSIDAEQKVSEKFILHIYITTLLSFDGLLKDVAGEFH